VSIADDARALLGGTQPEPVAHREIAPDLRELRGGDAGAGIALSVTDDDLALEHLAAYQRRLLPGMRGIVLPAEMVTPAMRTRAAAMRASDLSSKPQPVRCWEREP